MDIITYGLLNKKIKKKADLDSPHFTGEPTAPTPEYPDDSERLATTEYVKLAIGDAENTQYELSRDTDDLILTGTDGSVSKVKIPVEYGTISEWAGRAGEVSQQGVFYVYTNYGIDDEGNDIPAVKIGDGKAYIGDLPFTKTDFLLHQQDTSIHVTQAEKDAWNDKVRCYLSFENAENLIFTTEQRKEENNGLWTLYKQNYITIR